MSVPVAATAASQRHTTAFPIRRFERRAMGSALRLAVSGVSPGAALLAWGRVSDEFERAEQAMSRFRESSDLTRLNRAAGTGELVDVDRRLRRALASAWRAQRVTGGRFDPGVLEHLERLGYRGAAVPGGAPSTPWGEARWLGLDPRGSAAAIAGPVDVGGIGKGLALRWAWRRMWTGLASVGRSGALLEAGGDLVASGPSPDGGPWLVGIDDPGGDPIPLAVIAVEQGAVCTSSVAIHRWPDPDGRTVHHLIDPRTGEPGGAGLLSVTVAGADPAWSEVWSKALFLEGAGGIAAAARGRGLPAWWVAESGDLEMTPAARLLTVWTP